MSPTLISYSGHEELDQ